MSARVAARNYVTLTYADTINSDYKASNNMSKSFYGIGFNSKGKHKVSVKGVHTPAYKTWRNMIERCYCLKYQARQPTYIGCSVDDEWRDFQDFAEWFEAHEYSNHGYQLDKDILIPGNKIYSPDRCVFVPSQLNNLLLDSGAVRGQYPQGVRFYKNTNRFRASISINTKRKHLGYFDTELEAYQAYKKAKEANVKRMALEWQDRIADNVFDALMNWQLTE